MRGVFEVRGFFRVEWFIVYSDFGWGRRVLAGSEVFLCRVGREGFLLRGCSGWCWWVDFI